MDEVYLEDLDWPDVRKIWCTEIWGEVAKQWGYKLVQAEHIARKRLG